MPWVSENQRQRFTEAAYSDRSSVRGHPPPPACPLPPHLDSKRKKEAEWKRECGREKSSGLEQ